MEEDEEVVLKNTGLYSHLLESGFDDFEFIENNYSNSFIQDSDDQENIKETASVQDYQEFEQQIHAILNSNLVFSDDVLFVKNFAVHMKPLSTTAISFSTVYAELTAGTAAVSTVCLIYFMCGVKLKHWIYISLHMVPAGIYSVKYLYVVYCKQKRKKIVEKLIKNLKDLSLLVQKSIKFIQECEILAYNNWSMKMKSLPLIRYSYLGECEGMRHLRMSIFHAIRSSILDLRSLIAILVDNFPLKAHVNNLNFHLAFLSEGDLHCSYSNESSISVQQLQKMKYIYLLLQSEFLRQLSLCFIPALWTCNTKILLQNTFSLLSHFSQRCSKRHQQLKSIFLIYYTFEKSDTENLSKKPGFKWIYKEAYVKLCSLSFNLQTVLRGSRNMEEFLEETRASNPNHDDVVHQLDIMSEQIVRDYERCKTVLEDLRKYVTSLKPKAPGSVITLPAVQLNTDTKINILLGVTDFNPSGPDEVFVGVSEDQMMEAETAPLKETIKNPCSKLLISELKVALQSKAKEWKEREKIALKNKNIDTDDEEVAEICAKKILDDSGDELNQHRKRKLSYDDEISQYKFKPIPTAESSFAKQIAETSASWGLEAEEFFVHDENGEDE